MPPQEQNPRFRLSAVPEPNGVTIDLTLTNVSGKARRGYPLQPVATLNFASSNRIGLPPGSGLDELPHIVPRLTKTLAPGEALQSTLQADRLLDAKAAVDGAYEVRLRYSDELVNESGASSEVGVVDSNTLIAEVHDHRISVRLSR